MSFDNEKAAGMLLFFGTFQYLITILLLAVVEPGYSIKWNFISLLGIGTNALIFNLSEVIWGGSGFFAALILYRVSMTEPIFPARLFAVVIMVAAIAAIGGGLFPMRSTPVIPLHSYFTQIGLLSGVIAVFIAYKLVNPPFSYIQIIFGALSLLGVILFLTGTDLGFGVGGIERLAFYIFFVWILSFSTYLMNKS
ncbi:MAG: DUF998 domain-containing protein [Promethearchaeota archaeon]